MNQDKINAYMTLNTVLVTVAKLSAPFVPFMAETMYRNLVKTVDPNAPESVHMCDFPVVDETFVDAELEKNMELVLKIVVEGRACRNTANIKNRQPLGKMFVKSEFELPETFRELVMDELNVKELIFTNDAKHFTTYKFKPQLRTLGPRYGKLVPKIAQVLAGLDGNEAMDILDKGEKLTFEVDGTAIELAKDDVLIETAQKEGYVSETDRDVTVILDTNLTPELVEEGFVREIISKVQTMRKEAGFEVMDHIKLYYNGNEKIAEIMRNNMATICDEVLADSAEEGSAEGYGKEWNINGEKVFMVVVKV